jgi:hypothetical protein
MKPDFERILAKPTASVVEAGLVMGLARNAAYAAAQRGEIPVLKFGSRLRVPTVRLRAMLSDGVQAAAEIKPPTKSGPTR